MVTKPNKHPGGRPMKYQSVDELQQKIDDYFNTIDEDEWTITELALYCDMSRQDFINYQNKDKFFDTIKKAKQKIEATYEKSLRKYGRSGDIFALKNFGWVDKQEIDANVDSTITIEVNRDEV